jgi:phosphopantetheinyl transferase
VSRPRPSVLALPRGTPEVLFLDAIEARLDEPALLTWARALAHSAGSPYTSRAYRYPYALVACHSEQIGVEVERIEPFDQTVLESIRTPSEPLAPPAREDPAAFLSSLRCSKEALAKALGRAPDYDPRRLQAPLFWPDGRAGAWRAWQLPVPSGHNGWLCWRSSADGD